MGLATQLWIVDLDAIKSVWASRDEALLARLRNHGAGGEHEEMDLALRDILIGAACDQVPWARYYYALEAICYELRHPREIENDVYDREVRRLEELLEIGMYQGLEPFLPVDVTSFLPLPAGDGNFPLMGWVERGDTADLAERAAALAARVPAAHAAHPDSESAQIGDGMALTELASTYRTAADVGLDVVLFQH